MEEQVVVVPATYESDGVVRIQPPPLLERTHRVQDYRRLLRSTALQAKRSPFVCPLGHSNHRLDLSQVHCDDCSCLRSQCQDTFRR